MVLLRSLIDVFGHIRIDPRIPAVYVNCIIRCIIITRYFFQIYLGNFKFLISADLIGLNVFLYDLKTVSLAIAGDVGFVSFVKFQADQAGLGVGIGELQGKDFRLLTE